MERFNNELIKGGIGFQQKKQKSGKNISDVQEMNRALVLRTIRDKGECSRVELAKHSGLRQATITNIVGDLIESGIVEESNVIKNKRGRHSIGLRLNKAPYRIIGIRLSNKLIMAGLFDLTGTQHELIVEQINPREGVAVALKTLENVIARQVDMSADARVLAIGIGLPGPFFRVNERVTVMYEFPGWEDVNISAELGKVFNIPIYEEYDAYANAYAEWRFGGHHADSHVLLAIYMQYGMGGGVIKDGDLYHGSAGIAGNIGHITIDYDGKKCKCGNKGCLGNYCSSKALLNDIQQQMENSDIQTSLRRYKTLTLAHIVEACQEGDSFAISMVKRCARFMGYGLINLIYTYNPDTVILSDEFSEFGALYLSEIEEVLSERVLPLIHSKINISFTAIKDDPVLLGVIALVTDWILSEPSQFQLISKRMD